MSGRPPSTAASPYLGDAAWLGLAALVAHGAIALWAKDRFPPAADGSFYHTIATRISEGLGYTWLWPDGSVTFAAHYPVGYPGLLGLAYAIATPVPFVAMLVNALLAAAGAFAVHRLAARVASRGGALLGAALAAFHPGLLGYTAALMTEALCGAWLVVIAALSDRSARTKPWLGLAIAGVGLGLATLLRPQLVLLAPAFGVWAMRSRARAFGRRGWLSLLVPVFSGTALALLMSVPWTLRNCQRFGRCAWISTNAGWNLFIGAAPEASGTWLPVERIGIPSACRAVDDEAEKDRCFEQAARERIRSDPREWLSLVPAKLAATFNGGSPAASYLSSSNPIAFGATARLALGGVDTLFQRLTLGLALVAVFRRDGRNQKLRAAIVLGGLVGLFTVPAWLSVVALVLAGATLGRRLLDDASLYFCVTLLGTLLVTHAVFFGAQRYALVAAYMVAALAGSAFPSRLGAQVRDGMPRSPFSTP